MSIGLLLLAGYIGLTLVFILVVYCGLIAAKKRPRELQDVEPQIIADLENGELVEAASTVAKHQRVSNPSISKSSLVS